MRRVSSRQRLVSWDAFDATAGSGSENGNELLFGGYNDGFDKESYTSGYETAQSQSFHSSTDLEGQGQTAFEIQENNEFDENGTKLWTRRRKRDRKSLRSHCTERITICKNIECPNSSPPVTSTITAGAPTIVPSYSWETGKPAPSKMVPFDNLIDDLHIGIFSFLDLSSLRSVMSINRHYQKLMISNDARSSLWMDLCEKKWRIERKKGNESPLKFVDDFRLPLAATSTDTTTFGSEATDERTATTNLSLLLSLTPTYFPASVDQDILKPRTRLSMVIQQTIPAYRLEEEDQLIRCYQDSSTGRSVVQYTGHVGQGDRCIRTNYPLPRPSRPTYEIATDIYSRNNMAASASGATLLSGKHHDESYHPFLLNILRRSSKSMTRDLTRDGIQISSPLSPSLSPTSQLSSKLTPFVVPFIDQSTNETTTTVNVTPRFVSYFEVSILKLEDDNNSDDTISSATGTQTQRRSPTHRTSYNDCVAVGVAAKAFQYQSRMPGWDKQSYGYHGDDGGIFHSSGSMLKPFGPTYGPGDTVGCGIDYVSKGIFYTLNGEFLGYAWKRISDDMLQNDLFPTVGIDTNFPIHLNFGSADSGAFQFDLSKFIKKDEKPISSMYSMISTNGAAVKASNEVSTKKSACSFSLSPSRRQRKSLVRRRNHRDQ